MNIKSCWACHTGVAFQPLTNGKGEILKTNSICRNPSCPLFTQNLTKLALKKKKSSRSSKRISKPSKPQSRLLQGTLVMLVSAALSYNACIALANNDFTNNTVTYTSTTSTEQKQSTSTSSEKTAVSVGKSEITPEEFKAYFLEEATKAGVWVKKAEHMMKVESGGWNVHARGDQKILANGNGMCKNRKSPLYGKPANARGGAQITECWFPNISDEQADDYKFATKFMLDVILSGKDKCRMIYSTCDAFYDLQK